jgi:hypothetical protein
MCTCSSCCQHRTQDAAQAYHVTVHTSARATSTSSAAYSRMGDMLQGHHAAAHDSGQC